MGGGNLIIGVIIFVIIIIIQFIVINKGTERVSEVTARFTLDAMAVTDGNRLRSEYRCHYG